MVHRFIVLLFVWVCLIPSALAEKRVAVLEFKGVGIDRNILHKLSDQTRRAAIETLPQSTYMIITRENMMMILGDMGKDASCIEGSCEVDIGRNIGADIIVTGNIMKIDSHYSLTLTLYKTKDGSVLNMKEIYEDSLLNLVKETHLVSLSLFQDGLKLQDDSNIVVVKQDKKAQDNWKSQKDSNIVVVEQNEKKTNVNVDLQETNKNDIKVTKDKHRAPKNQKNVRSNRKYNRLSVGFLALSGLSYGASYATHKEYLNITDETLAENVFLINQVTTASSIIFLGLSGRSYVLGRKKPDQE